MTPTPNSDYRLLIRAAGISRNRPDPPRDVRANAGFARWSAPRRLDGVTHYAVRIDRDSGQPDLLVPVGTSTVSIPPGDRCCVSSFNASSRLESGAVTVPIQNNGSTSSGAVLITITLAAGSDPQDVEVPLPTNAGQILALEIINNAAGNGVAEPGEMFEEDTSLDISGYQNSVNRFLFIGKDGLWCIWASHFLGV